MEIMENLREVHMMLPNETINEVIKLERLQHMGKINIISEAVALFSILAKPLNEGRDIFVINSDGSKEKIRYVR
jgi:hypothetical protein